MLNILTEVGPPILNLSLNNLAYAYSSLNECENGINAPVRNVNEMNYIFVKD